jgi:uncharacterized phage protein (TIGR02220 family)
MLLSRLEIIIEEFFNENPAGDYGDSWDPGKLARYIKMRAERDGAFSEEIKEILGYLNEVSGKQFSLNTSTKNAAFIRARLTEGYSVADCKRVINTKLGDSFFQDNPKFLRPRTLFDKNKFEDYLNETISVKKESTWQVR